MAITLTPPLQMTAVFQEASTDEAELQDIALRSFVRWSLSRKQLLVDEPHCKLLKIFVVGAPTKLKKENENEL